MMSITKNHFKITNKDKTLAVNIQNQTSNKNITTDKAKLIINNLKPYNIFSSPFECYSTSAFTAEADADFDENDLDERENSFTISIPIFQKNINSHYLGFTGKQIKDNTYSKNINEDKHNDDFEKEMFYNKKIYSQSMAVHSKKMNQKENRFNKENSKFKLDTPLSLYNNIKKNDNYIFLVARKEVERRKNKILSKSDNTVLL